MKRALVVLIAALFVCVGGAVTVGAALEARTDQMRGFVDPLTEDDLPTRVPLFGVNTDLNRYSSDDDLRAQLDAMRAIGVHWVRQEVRWDVVSPGRGIVDFAAYDRLVSAVDAAGLKLVIVLGGTPSWARDRRATASATAPPQSNAAFAAFAASVARRYGGTVDHYQIWDEPNLESGWGGLPAQPVDYLALLAAVYPAIHAQDARATVMLAALAPTVEQGGSNLSDWRFLQNLYELGGAPYFDAAAGKPYGFDLPAEDRTIREDTLNFARFIGLRDIMVANGDRDVPLWGSNFGWNTLPDDWTGAPSIWGAVDPEHQRRYTLDALARASNEWAWAGGMILHHWQPNAPCGDPQWGFALIDCAGIATPLYHSLHSRPRPAHATTGVHPVTSPDAAYYGVWTFSPLGADIGWIDDSRATFTFEGESIGLRLREDDYTAFLYVTIDGAPANALPRDELGRTYVNLSSDTQEPKLTIVPLAHDLAPGLHTLALEAERGWDRWAIAAYVVGADDRAAPYDRQIAVGVVTTAVGLSAFFLVLPRLGVGDVLRRRTLFLSTLSSTTHLFLSAAAAIGTLIGMLLAVGGNQALFRREPIYLPLAVLTAGLVYLQPHIVLLLVSLVVLSILLYHQPRTGLILTLFFAPFFLFPVELVRFAFPMTELMLLLTCTAGGLRVFTDWSGAWRGGDRRLLHHPIRFNALDTALAAWLLCALAAIIWSAVTARAVTELRSLFIEPIAFYVLIRLYGRDRAFLVRLVDTLLIAGVVVSIVGLFLYARGEGIITAEDGVRRLASVYGSPNNVALFLGRCFPFAVTFALIPVGRWRRMSGAAAALIMIVTIVLTQSAGALFLGVPLSVIVLLLLIRHRRTRLMIVGLAASAVVALPLVMRSARFARLLDFSEGTNFFRLRVWQSAIEMIADRPITGLGLDQFLYLYRGHYLRPDAWQEPDLSHPHNLILDSWLRLGIVGLLVTLWIQIVFWRHALALYRRLRERDLILWALVVGSMGAMIDLLAHGLVDNSFFVIDLAFVFVFLIAIISNIRAIDVEP